jgi:hypothetical protein
MVLSAWVLVAAAAAQSSTMWLGVDDGQRVRPVARYDGGRWTSTCDVPQLTGAPAKRVTAPPASGPGQSMLVSIGSATVEPVRVVPTASDEWRRTETVVRRLFGDRERREKISTAALASVPIAIEMIAAAGSGRQRVYYFRAAKRVPDGRTDAQARAEQDIDPAGDLRVAVSGWFSLDGTRSTSLGTAASLSWEQVDERGVSPSSGADFTPLGIIDAGGARVWVMQRSTGSSATFALYDVGARGVTLRVRSDPRQC